MIFSQVDTNYDEIVVKFDSDSNTKRKNCIVQFTLYLTIIIIKGPIFILFTKITIKLFPSGKS